MTESVGDANLATSCALVDEFVARGVHDAVVCPGSRSTPLAIALAGHPGMEVRVLIDERSAGFFGLGMARARERPIILLCTSGTAAANFFPSVVEAHLSRVPLVVLTADRPPELRDWGAAQTINQINLFGDHVKWFVDMPVPESNGSLWRHARAVAARSVGETMAPPAGPVHINLPYREPLLPPDFRSNDDLGPHFDLGRSYERLDTLPSPRAVLDDSSVHQIARYLQEKARGLIVVGPGAPAGVEGGVSALSQVTGYPVLADALSGVRYAIPGAANRVSSYDAFLRDTETASQLAPDMVIRTGAVPTSKPLQQFLQAQETAVHIIIDEGAPRDPGHQSSLHLDADPASTLSRLAEMLAVRGFVPEPGWLARWLEADRVTRRAITASLDENDALFEGRVPVEIIASLPRDATLFVGNSMPVRDLDTFGLEAPYPLRPVANRGANGIDGVISSALGATAVASGPVVLVLGDLSFYHDMNGLLAAGRFGLSATIVVLNNHGGGIFSFLPQTTQVDQFTFEQLFGTPVDLDIAAVAKLYGASFSRPPDWSSFRRALLRGLDDDGLSIIEVETDRESNVQMHRAISSAVAAALQRGALARVGHVEH